MQAARQFRSAKQVLLPVEEVKGSLMETDIHVASAARATSFLAAGVALLAVAALWAAFGRDGGQKTADPQCLQAEPGAGSK